MRVTVKTTKHNEIVDMTDMLEDEIAKNRWKDGLVNIFVTHTTCALTTMDLDPGTDLDFLDAIKKIFPKGEYRHPHDPSHVGEHIMSSLIGNSISVPVENGKFVLGTWQRIVLVELSGPRSRSLVLSFQSRSE